MKASDEATGTFLYRYQDAINGFFELPTGTARDILPRGLQPVETRHGSSILAVTGFEFSESGVGAYREVVLSVIVSPRLEPGQPMPRAAMYPFIVGTTTPESRAHGIGQWRLPHLMTDLDVRFDRADREIRLAARAGGADILAMTVTDAGNVSWETVEHQYQTFMKDSDGSYLSELTMAGTFLEHEEERGSLTLHHHEFTAALDPDEVSTTPFREQWMRQGLETIFPLQTLPAFSGR